MSESLGGVMTLTERMIRSSSRGRKRRSVLLAERLSNSGSSVTPMPWATRASNEVVFLTLRVDWSLM